MKPRYTLFLILITLTSLTGCRNALYDVANERKNDELTERAAGHTLTYMAEWEELTSYIEVARWISDHVDYVADTGADSWEDPQVTLDRGYGDCEDYSLLFMNIVYVAFGLEPDLLAVEMESLVFDFQRAIADGGSYDHAILRIDPDAIDIYTGFIYDEYEVSYYFSFWEVFTN